MIPTVCISFILYVLLLLYLPCQFRYGGSSVESIGRVSVTDICGLLSVKNRQYVNGRKHIDFRKLYFLFHKRNVGMMFLLAQSAINVQVVFAFAV